MRRLSTLALLVVVAGCGGGHGTTAPRFVTVPDVTGRTAKAAQVVLRKDELCIGEITVVKQKPRGRKPPVVLRQQPKAGARLPRASKIHLVVSAGGPTPTRNVPLQQSATCP